MQILEPIPVYFSFVLLNEFVIMPNHIHGILTIDKRNDNDFGWNGDGDGDVDVETRHCLALSLQYPTPIPSAKPNKTKSPKKTITKLGKNTILYIIGSYKSGVTEQARKINLDFGLQ
jgi:hypothetical protein